MAFHVLYAVQSPHNKPHPWKPWSKEEEKKKHISIAAWHNVQWDYCCALALGLHLLWIGVPNKLTVKLKVNTCKWKSVCLCSPFVGVGDVRVREVQNRWMAPSTGPVAACYPLQQVLKPPVYIPVSTSELRYCTQDLICAINICETEKLLSLKLCT